MDSLDPSDIIDVVARGRFHVGTLKDGRTVQRSMAGGRWRIREDTPPTIVPEIGIFVCRQAQAMDEPTHWPLVIRSEAGWCETHQVKGDPLCMTYTESTANVFISVSFRSAIQLGVVSEEQVKEARRIASHHGHY